MPDNRNYLYSSLGPLKGWSSYLVLSIFEAFVTTKAAVCDAFYIVFGFSFIWSLNFWIKKSW